MAESSVLHADRLHLVPFSEAYLTDRYVGWLNDAETMRFSRWSASRQTKDTCRAYVEQFAATPNYLWAIVAQGADQGLGHIGNISAAVDPRHELADVSILVGERSVWGRGFGGEAWMRVCRFLFEELHIRKISAGTLATNAGMLGIMRKAGMQDDGRRVRHYLQDGAEVDVVQMSLFRSGWTPR